MYEPQVLLKSSQHSTEGGVTGRLLREATEVIGVLGVDLPITGVLGVDLPVTGVLGVDLPT